MMTIPVVQRPSEGLNVIGEATRSAEPEIVEATFDVHSAGPSAAQALRDNAMKVMHLGQALMALGIPQSDVQTGAAAVHPLYQPGFPMLPQAPGFPQLGAAGASPFAPMVPQSALPPELQQVAGYHVVNFLKISLRDLGRLGEVVDTATRAGATPSAGFLYRLRDEPALRRTLLEAAGRDARSKAEVLASALGKQLGDPSFVAEDYSAYYLGGGDGIWHNQPPWLASRPAVSPGNLTFQARVNVTYRLQ